MANALSDAGFSVDLTDPIPPLAVVVTAQRGDAVIKLPAGGFAQIAGELLDPRHYAQALYETVEARAPPGQGILTLSNEEGVWR